MKTHCKWLCAALACLLLCGASSALALGTLPKENMTAEELPQMERVAFPKIEYTAPASGRDNYPYNPDNFSEDGMRYHDDSLDVQLHNIRVHDTPVVIAYVQIADPKQLRTEQAKPYPSKATYRIDMIAKPVQSVFAVNADWFTYHNLGIVYRNGERLRNRDDAASDGLVIDTEGNLHIIRPMTAEEYDKLDVEVWQSFAFGPALVMNGEVLEIVNRKITYKQRMAIGQVDELCYVFAAADGPDQPNSVGLNVPQLAQLMYDLGAHTAYNLDGGQSTSMLMGKTKVNGQAPKTMRAIGDIIYFTTAIPNE